ncbi:putative DNA-binding protein [Escherichia coli]|nr:putative DNA-binding protein [Escherichia coli]
MNSSTLISVMRRQQISGDGMQEYIDYQIEKYQFRARHKSPQLMRQWEDVMRECRDTGAGARERLRTALLNVDYVTSFELPFRLLLTRTPQMIDSLRREWLLSQKKVLFNGRQRGCVYSLQNDLSGVPDCFSYSLVTRIRRVDSYGMTTRCFTDIAGQVKAPTARLKLALESGLIVTALDGLFWPGTQRIAADVQRLRQSGMVIVTREVEVSDTLTGTTRLVSAYTL